MSERAPRPNLPDKTPEPITLIETQQQEPRTIETPYGQLAFVCHQGESAIKRTRPEQQDAITIVSDESRLGIGVIDGITHPSSGKEASLFLATQLKRAFQEKKITEVSEATQHTMQTYGQNRGGALFAAVELPEKRITWIGDVRATVIPADGSQPFTTVDHTDPDTGILTRQVGAAYTFKPDSAVFERSLQPGDIIALMSDGIYKNFPQPEQEFELEDDELSAPDDGTNLYDERSPEQRDAEWLKNFLKTGQYQTPAQAVAALNKIALESPAYSDNVTLAILFVDKKIP